METLTKTSLVIAVLKRLAHARKAGVVLAAALIGSAALSSSTLAAARAHYVKPREQYRAFNPRVPQERPSRYPWYINRLGEPGYGPAPTGQYPSFEMLDHFP
jgi:hypothetical protein